MTTQDDTTFYKTCRKCGKAFPATPEYFAREKHGKYGLRGDCKICGCKRTNDYRLKNPDKAVEYRAAHREQHKAYLAANPKDRTEYQQKYRAEHREEILAHIASYNAANPEKRRAILHRRRARKAALPDTLTSHEIKLASGYFGGLCAVCGKQANTLFSPAHLDHWIPLSKGGGTVAENMVPLCQRCNQSKCAADPIKWLVRTFGKRKASIIAKRIAEFFEWVKVQE